MIRAWTISLAALLVLTACADSDKDGLTNAREAHLGTDPQSADTDGDGLSDKAELKAGTDPLKWDTDGDGYSDFQEIDYGSDPLNYASVIYEGGWPYNPEKDTMSDPGLDGHPVVGSPIGRFVTIDQFGEQVDFYDYAHQGKPIMVDVAALWCGPCRHLAGWLHGNNMAGMQTYEPVRQAVQNGDLLWVTVIGENQDGGEPALEDLQWWDEHYPNDQVAVLADSSDLGLVDYFNLRFWPSLFLLDENMNLVKGPGMQDWEPPLAQALQLLTQDSAQ